MRTHIFSVKHFRIVVRADTQARVNKVSCKQAIYLVFIALMENNSWSAEPDLDSILLLYWLKIIREEWPKKR